MIKIDINKKLNASGGEMNLQVKVQIPSGRRVAVYGESGAGKTSLLRMISGLMNPDNGIISFNGTQWTNTAQNINIPPRKRSVGYVFQDYALFPNMTVQKNLSYAVNKTSEKGIIDKLTAIFELDNFLTQYPSTLSGGQQQRVALARSLIRKPDILLLDEPLSALDFQLKRKIQEFLKIAQQEFGFTMFLVTHDHAEIFHLADHLLWLKDGRLAAQGRPSAIFTSENVSGKFKMTGEIIHIHHDEIIDIVEVLVGQEIVQVVVDRNSITSFAVGDKVVVASKAFNPIIQHLHG